MLAEPALQDNNQPASSSRGSVKDYVHRHLYYDEGSSRKKHLDKLFTKMIAVDMEPLRMGEREGLREFVAALDNKYVLPDTATLTNKLLPQMYSELKVEVMKAVRESETLSITADMWTSTANEGILAITGHFIAKDKLVSPLLSVIKVEGSHSAENLAQVIDDSLSSWGCRDKVISMVTDNLSTMLNCADLLHIKHIPCLAHTLNLTVTDSFKVKGLAEFLSKCKKIVTFFRHSTLASEKLKQIQRENGNLELKLLQQVDTRWNSVYYMLERLRIIRQDLTLAISQCERAPENLTAEDYKIIDGLITIYQPFEVATSMVSGESYSSLCIILPVLKGLALKLVDLASTDLQDLPNAVLNCITESVNKRLKPYEKRSYCILASLLNPNYSQISSRQEKEAVKESKVRDLLSFLEDPLPTSNPTSDAIIDVRQYVEKPNIGHSENAVDYWKKSTSKLKYLAYKYLAIPATSCPAERIFSAAGQVLTERRNRLKSKHLQEILFIKQNFKMFNDKV
ncbi:hypothetical protein JTE90_028678 [Oedothorax gibbosus]|uniref:HAT C-terminal dimerisation domain-containing protein n=1 Tax=Oedothorax gibbosus TaxID=931172 RepID=A0AAV6TT38_9ARAC|nr:hypothetical protein JTE90_028678 [Oedothorax gibbosus]